MPPVPVALMQTPALQVDPAGHGLHPPQCVASPPVGETQAPSEHCVSPVGHIAWQVPLLHTSMPEHTVVQFPQCAAFEGTQVPLQANWPAPHAHWPAWQTWPAGQAFPQVPQFRASVATVLQRAAAHHLAGGAAWPSTLPWQLATASQAAQREDLKSDSWPTCCLRLSRREIRRCDRRGPDSDERQYSHLICTGVKYFFKRVSFLRPRQNRCCARFLKFGTRGR